MTIAEQDASIPRCNRACSTCYGFNGRASNHHWMIDYEESDSQDETRMVLICRHCDAKIEEFDVDDPDCPEV